LNVDLNKKNDVTSQAPARNLSQSQQRRKYFTDSRRPRVQITSCPQFCQRLKVKKDASLKHCMGNQSQPFGASPSI